MKPHAFHPSEDLERIHAALVAAGALLAEMVEHDLDVERKDRGDPVTEADLAADDLLRRHLLRAGEGWLSEETVDDRQRLDHRRVWVVDPLDGTKEFLKGLPEWCVSVALVIAGRPVAGGIFNPLADQLVLGGEGEGVTLNGEAVITGDRRNMEGAVVLASRSEIGRGEWRRFEDAGVDVRPTGSVAYKLGLVAAGLADATWTLTPKNEWDVAAGAALVEAAGGRTWVPQDGAERTFNQPKTRMPGFAAAGPALAERLPEWLETRQAAG